MKNLKIIFACTIAMSCILKANIATAATATQPCKFCTNGCARYSSTDASCCILCDAVGGGGTGGGGEVTPTGCDLKTCSTGQYFSGVLPLCCSSCPSQDGATGTSKNNNDDFFWQPEITECYITANTPMTDKTGTYVFTSDCYYSNQWLVSSVSDQGTRCSLSRTSLINWIATVKPWNESEYMKTSEAQFE